MSGDESHTEILFEAEAAKGPFAFVLFEADAANRPCAFVLFELAPFCRCSLFSFFFPFLLSLPVGLGFSFGTSVPRPSFQSGAEVSLGDAALRALFIHYYFSLVPGRSNPPDCD